MAQCRGGNGGHELCTRYITSMKARYEQNIINVLARGHIQIAMGHHDSTNTTSVTSMGHK